MNKYRLQRQGVAESAHCRISDHLFVQIFYHHGWKSWIYDEEKTNGNETTSKYVKVQAGSLQEAIKMAGDALRVEFEPEIEHYYYCGEKTLSIWPHIADDVYLTCATYEPGTDTIRHEPSNVCLVFFRGTEWPVKAKRYSDDRANDKYEAEIDKALSCYNSNVKAHGTGQERKEWLAWLISEYVKGREGERPKKLASICREHSA